MASAPRVEATGRRYGGLTAQERRDARRLQLVQAGMEVFGTLGPSGASVRAVLRESGLAERYFHESFASLEDLHLAVHESIHQTVLEAVRDATDAAEPTVAARARAGVRAFVETIMADPHWVRIKLDAFGDRPGPKAQEFHREAQERFADLLLAHGPREAAVGRGMDPLALARAVVRGVESLVDDWAAGALAVDLDGLLDHAVLLITATADALDRPV